MTSTSKPKHRPRKLHKNTNSQPQTHFTAFVDISNMPGISPFSISQTKQTTPSRLSRRRDMRLPLRRARRSNRAGCLRDGILRVPLLRHRLLDRHRPGGKLLLLRRVVNTRLLGRPPLRRLREPRLEAWLLHRRLALESRLRNRRGRESTAWWTAGRYGPEALVLGAGEIEDEGERKEGRGGAEEEQKNGGGFWGEAGVDR